MNQASLAKKKRRTKAAGRAPQTAKAVAASASDALAPRAWRWMGGAILAASAVLRLYELTLKPLHHDEGVNGAFLTTLFRGGAYVYDPQNYHGPSLYYAAWVVTTINSVFYGRDGLSTFAIRLVTALFGIGIVWLLLCLRKQLGWFGALAAAALATVSPGMVFFSRYFIHEILFVFFTLAIVVCVLRYRETRRPRDLLLAVASAALLGATKETWVITMGVWLIAVPCTIFYQRVREIQGDAATEKQARPAKVVAMPAESASQPAWSNGKLYATAAGLFLAIWIVLYSSFFTNFPKGVIDSVRTFKYWFVTSSSQHEFDWNQYLVWLSKLEMPLLILGALGILIALWRARESFAVFAAFWSLGILGAYSLIHYKTPWCALNIILPFIIMAGYSLERLYRSFVGRWAILPLAVAAGMAAYQAIDLNFVRYDDDTEPYVYAHTYRGFLPMIDEIDRIAAGLPEGKNVGITMMSPEHWPLPWYLRDYPNVGYFGRIVDSIQPILIVHENQLPAIDHIFGSRYRNIGGYDLRPGNRLFLYVRRDVDRSK